MNPWLLAIPIAAWVLYRRKVDDARETTADLAGILGAIAGGDGGGVSGVALDGQGRPWDFQIWKEGALWSWEATFGSERIKSPGWVSADAAAQDMAREIGIQ